MLFLFPKNNLFMLSIILNERKIYQVTVATFKHIRHGMTEDVEMMLQYIRSPFLMLCCYTSLQSSYKKLACFCLLCADELQEIILPNIVVEWLAVLFHIQEILDKMYSGLRSANLTRILMFVYQSLQIKLWDIILKEVTTVFCHTFSKIAVTDCRNFSTVRKYS